MTSRHGGLAGIALAAAVALTACGGGSSARTLPDNHASSPVDTLKVIHAAAAANARVRSVHMVGSLTEYLQHVKPIAGQPAVTVDFSSKFNGVIRPKPLAGRITLSGLTSNGQSLGGAMTELMTPDAMYLKSPQLAAKTGKPWVVMRFDELAAASGVDLRQMMAQAEQMNPADYINQLVKAGDVRRVGNEIVRGVATVHYSGTVPISASLAHFSGATRALMSRTMRSTGIKTTQVDVWLDGHGLIRRATSSAQSESSSVQVQMEVIAYDVPVPVTPPPAAQTVDLARLR
jgi:hypothetical protein